MDEYKLIIGFLSGFVLAFVNYRFSRSSNKKAKKTEMRSQSYIDFLDSISGLAHMTSQDSDKQKDLIVRLADAKARIAIYGDSSVIKELAAFDRKYKKLDSEDSYDTFMKIVYEMRTDAVGKRKKDDLKDLKQIIFGL